MGTAYELSASLRERIGKGGARAARRDGKVPAVIYGGAEAPVSINLSYKDTFLKIHGGGFLTTVFTLDVDGSKIRVIPRDYQLDPVSDKPIHVDFLRVGEHATLTVDIHVRFVNEQASPGIKRGGVLNIVRHTIEVTCPADDIPTEFVADLTGLDINDSIHISSIALPENVVPTIRDRDFTIATIAAPAGFNEDQPAAAKA